MYVEICADIFILIYNIGRTEKIQNSADEKTGHIRLFSDFEIILAQIAFIGYIIGHCAHAIRNSGVRLLGCELIPFQNKGG
jgi:hypothetical protein